MDIIMEKIHIIFSIVFFGGCWGLKQGLAKLSMCSATELATVD
jgi:hypothetical protein